MNTTKPPNKRQRLRRIPIAPRSIIRLVRLWPHARKQGRQLGQVWRVGYFCRCCGTGIIPLVDQHGAYSWTIDEPFLRRHFEIVVSSNERSVYGRGRPKLLAFDPDHDDAA